ncbi:MAG: hypothetical protein IJF79_06610, partial [Clostridia bacterium]|nr:hypothetical protein [Clostridia bacterium]
DVQHFGTLCDLDVGLVGHDCLPPVDKWCFLSSFYRLRPEGRSFADEFRKSEFIIIISYLL